MNKFKIEVIVYNISYFYKSFIFVENNYLFFRYIFD